MNYIDKKPEMLTLLRVRDARCATSSLQILQIWTIHLKIVVATVLFSISYNVATLTLFI